MRTNLLIGITVAVLCLSNTPVILLAEVRSGSEVLITKDEVIDDDLYIFAQNATVNGTVKGDLIVFGQQITINGSVDGDLFVAAQLVWINGTISDDVRIAGQVLTLQQSADVGDDLIAASYSLECAKASNVGGEVKYAGNQSVFAGHVEKKVELASANSELSGSFGADVEAVVDGGDYATAGFFGSEVPTVPQGLHITESADIAGNLIYQSPREAIINPDSVIAGDVEYSPLDSDVDQPTIANRAVAFAKQFFALLVVGLLVVFTCPQWTRQVVNNVGRRPLASLTWGVLTLVAVIAGAILLLVATIAVAVLLGFVSLDNLISAWVWMGVLSIGVVVVGFWIYAAWIAKVIVSVWAGNRIINGQDWVSSRRILALALGVLIFAALSWIPTVGSIVSLIVVLIGVGSTAIWMFTKSEPLIPSKQKM